MVNKADLSSIGNIISKAISDNDLFLHSYPRLGRRRQGENLDSRCRAVSSCHRSGIWMQSLPALYKEEIHRWPKGE